MKKKKFTDQEMADFLKTRSRKRVGAGAIFRNEKGEILLVKPSYTDYWQIPGGHGEANESPFENCRREVKEEVGLDMKDQKLVCVNYLATDMIPNDEVLIFVFDGGVLTEKEIESIVLQEDELDEMKFVDLKDLPSFLSIRNNKMISFCLGAIEAKDVVYLEG